MQDQAKVGAVAARPQPRVRGRGSWRCTVHGSFGLDGRASIRPHGPQFRPPMHLKLFNGHGLVPPPAAQSDFIRQHRTDIHADKRSTFSAIVRQQRPFCCSRSFAAAANLSQQENSIAELPKSAANRESHHQLAKQTYLRWLSQSRSHPNEKCSTDQRKRGGLVVERGRLIRSGRSIERTRTVGGYARDIKGASQWFRAQPVTLGRRGIRAPSAPPITQALVSLIFCVSTFLACVSTFWPSLFSLRGRTAAESLSISLVGEPHHRRLYGRIGCLQELLFGSMVRWPSWPQSRGAEAVGGAHFPSL